MSNGSSQYAPDSRASICKENDSLVWQKCCAVNNVNRWPECPNVGGVGAKGG